MQQCVLDYYLKLPYLTRYIIKILVWLKLL